MTKPNIFHFEYKHFLADVINLIISVFVVLWLAPFNTENPFAKYLPVYACFAGGWLLFAWLFGRYAQTIRKQGYFPSIFRAANASIVAYAIAVGVNSMNTPPVEPKEPTPEELMALYESNPEFQEMIEKKRLAALKQSQQVPPFSASSGAVNAALNIKDKPKTFEEASERTRRMFGLD